MSDSAPDAVIDLSNHFLIAMPNMVDPNFAGSLVFVAEHNERGALGVVINRLTDMNLATLLSKIDLSAGAGTFSSDLVYFGGPVQTDRGFVLHCPLGHWNSTLTVGDAESTEAIGLTSSRDILEALVDGRGPQRIIVALGYSGWGPGQLEQELAQNAWLTVKADPSLIFEQPVETRLAAAFGLLGIDPLLMTGVAGHA